MSFATPNLNFEAQVDSLGINTKLITTSQNDANEKRFKLLDHIGKLLPDERVANCLRYISPHAEFVQIAKSKDGNGRTYKNLAPCGSIWHCPICSARITEHRKQELIKAVSNTDYKLVLITYTLRHHREDKLKDLLDALKFAFKKMREGGKWTRFKQEIGIVGAILATEITHGMENGWHPHRHELMFLPANTEKWQIALLEQKLKTLWDKGLRLAGFDASWERGVHVNADENLKRDYIAKWGHEPKDQHWTTVHELVKAPSKKGQYKGRTLFQLAQASLDGDLQSGELFKEGAMAMKRSNQLHYSDGLREILGLSVKEPTEEELAATPLPEDEREVMLELDRAQWWEIVKRNLRGKVLDQAKVLNKEELWQWLTEQGVQRRYRWVLVPEFERSRYLVPIKVYDG